MGSFDWCSAFFGCNRAACVSAYYIHLVVRDCSSRCPRGDGAPESPLRELGGARGGQRELWCLHGRRGPPYEKAGHRQRPRTEKCFDEDGRPLCRPLGGCSCCVFDRELGHGACCGCRRGHVSGVSRRHQDGSHGQRQGRRRGELFARLCTVPNFHRACLVTLPPKPHRRHTTHVATTHVATSLSSFRQP